MLQTGTVPGTHKEQERRDGLTEFNNGNSTAMPRRWSRWRKRKWWR